MTGGAATRAVCDGFSAKLYLSGAQRYNLKRDAEVAQLVEQLIRNQQVVGSSPTFGSINSITYRPSAKMACSVLPPCHQELRSFSDGALETFLARLQGLRFDLVGRIDKRETGCGAVFESATTQSEPTVRPSLTDKNHLFGHFRGPHGCYDCSQQILRN